MIKHLKNKRYWILMSPFFITAILLFTFLPNKFRHYSMLVIVVFWIVYSYWNYYTEKKNKSEKNVFDYIVIRAETEGGVVAKQLIDDLRTSILVLESGINSTATLM